MAQENAENRPAESKPTQVGLVRTGDHIVTIYENENTLLVQVTRDNNLVASLAVPTIVYDASTHTHDLATLPNTTPQEEEHKLITIEGYVGRTPAYRDSKHPKHKGEKELFFPVSFRPDPRDRDRVLWYDVLVFGDKAGQWNKEQFPPKGKAVHIEGKDYTHTKIVKTKQEGEKERTFLEIHATDVKVINARPKPGANE
jgi:hypothetical protein